MSDCLTQKEKISALSWSEQATFWWDGGDIRFLLDQQAELDVYSGSPLQQHTTVDMIATSIKK